MQKPALEPCCISQEHTKDANPGSDTAERDTRQQAKPWDEDKMEKMRRRSRANRSHAIQRVFLLLFCPSAASMKPRRHLTGTDHHVPLRRPAHRRRAAARVTPGRISPNRVHEEEARPGAGGAISPRSVLCEAICRQRREEFTDQLQPRKSMTQRRLTMKRVILHRYQGSSSLTPAGLQMVLNRAVAHRRRRPNGRETPIQLYGRRYGSVGQLSSLSPSRFC